MGPAISRQAPFQAAFGPGLVLFLVTTCGLLLAQKQQIVLPREFREYPGDEYENFPLPSD